MVRSIKPAYATRAIRSSVLTVPRIGYQASLHTVFRAFCYIP
jgi:hypothetical protein